MIDRQVIALAVTSMSPEGRQAAEAEAVKRCMRIEDVVLEANLEMVQKQLYSLRRVTPALTVIEGGRA